MKSVRLDDFLKIFFSNFMFAEGPMTFLRWIFFSVKADLKNICFSKFMHLEFSNVIGLFLNYYFFCIKKNSGFSKILSSKKVRNRDLMSDTPAGMNTNNFITKNSLVKKKKKKWHAFRHNLLKKNFKKKMH